MKVNYGPLSPLSLHRNFCNTLTTNRLLRSRWHIGLIKRMPTKPTGVARPINPAESVWKAKGVVWTLQWDGVEMMWKWSGVKMERKWNEIGEKQTKV